ncbi:MAG: lysylphosphatidylglycerol synthase transmembrane domain-containing protein [Halobacteriota archaeon]
MSRTSRVRSWLWLLGRVVVSVTLLWYVVTSVGLGTIVDHVLELPAWVLPISLGLAVLNIGISAYKWQLLLRLRDIHLPARTLFVYYYVGQFFNAFLPTSIGGDGVRMYYLDDRHGIGPDAVSSVVLERVTGLLSIFVFAGVGGVVLFDQLPSWLASAVVLGSVGGTAFFLLVLFDRRVRRLLDATVFRVGHLGLGDRLAAVHDALMDYRGRTRGLGLALGLSLLFRLIVVVNTTVVAVGIGMDIPLGYYVVIVPVVEVLLLVPVSIQGFGVRETSYLHLFGAVGADAGLAVVLGVVMQLVLAVFNNLLGGVVYVLEGVWSS